MIGCSAEILPIRHLSRETRQVSQPCVITLRYPSILDRSAGYIGGCEQPIQACQGSLDPPRFRDTRCSLFVAAFVRLCMCMCFRFRMWFLHVCLHVASVPRLACDAGNHSSQVCCYNRDALAKRYRNTVRQSSERTKEALQGNLCLASLAQPKLDNSPQHRPRPSQTLPNMDRICRGDPWLSENGTERVSERKQREGSDKDAAYHNKPDDLS
ncbi:hypothetical protein CC79DRAFT_544713 [Sarocladium strictum]